ncbi:hypothetical protein P8452_37964 [Trifolium repens]|nr:hypothetical protein P8452_37964 [Trifolium repens]
MKFYDLGNTHHKTTQARLSVGISLPPHLPILLSPPFLNFSFIFSLQLFSIFFPLPSTFLTFAEAHICLEIVVHEFEEKGYCLCFWTKKHGSNFQYTDKLANKVESILFHFQEKSWNYRTEFAPILEQGGAISFVAEALRFPKSKRLLLMGLRKKVYHLTVKVHKLG